MPCLPRTISSRLVQLVVAGILAVAAIESLHADDPSSDRAERAFLRQLTERQLFSLAEQHCRELLANAVNSDQMAEWLLRLSRTTQKHAWFADAASRPGLLNRTVEDITDFLKVESPAAERNLQLRLQQIRAFAARVRMQLVLAEAGHLFGRRTPPDQHAASPATRHSLSRDDQAAVDRGIELSVALLKQLEAIRKNLNPGHAQTIRDEARLLLGELHSLNWRLNSTGANQLDLLSTADNAVSAAVRSSRAGQNSARAAWLLAELRLHSSDAESFQLQAGSLATESGTDEIPPGEFLTIRDLLFRKEAGKALRLIDETRPGTALQQQHLQWLKLEALLGLRELAGQLSDLELITETTARFLAERDMIQRASRGVFGDAVEEVSRRFDLVNEVGTEIADLIEQIETRRQTGADKSALQLINVALQRLPPTRSQLSRSALQLRAGEILIQQRQWPDAVVRLERAVEGFKTVKMPTEQSAADLLRIFAMSQMVGQPLTDGGVTEVRYTAALENHLREFADQPTARTANDWLQKIVSVKQPLRAAKLALDQYADEVSPTVAVDLLLQAGKSLNKVVATDESEELAALQRQLVQHVSEVLVASGDSLDGLRQVRLELLLLEDKFQSADLQARWSRFEPPIRRLQTLLEDADEAEESADKEEFNDAKLRLQLLETIVAARTTMDVSRLAELRKKALDIADADLVRTIRFIDDQYGRNTLRPGDTWLAETNGQLLTRLLQQADPQSGVDELLWMLPAASRVAAFSGNAESLSQLFDMTTKIPLNGQQLKSLAQAVAKAGETTHRTERHDGSTAAERSFWQQVLTSRDQGTDSWLEASLQLAQIAADGDDVSGARKRIGVVEALYPDWGTPARRTRAQQLMKRLRE